MVLSDLARHFLLPGKLAAHKINDHARRHIAVVDHTKFGVVGNWRICDTATLKTLITDSGASDEMIAPFQKLGIEVIRV